jgi:prepilin signal peptidase PulO-like enzyme (type II secretory pathway)
VLLPVLFLASLQGSVIGIGLLALSRRRGRSGASDPQPAGDADGRPPEQVPLRYAKLPFGPFLSLAALEVLAFRPWVMGFFPYL